MESRLSFRFLALGVVVLLVACAGSAGAASLYFDSAGSTIWDDGTTLNWGAATGGPYDSAWVGGSGAVFEGTAGTVTVDPNGIASVDSMTFATDGYTVTGGTVTLTGTGIIDSGAGTATMSGVLAGSVGMTKTGSGTLQFGATTYNGTYTGGTFINAGTVKLGVTNNDGSGSRSWFGTGLITMADATAIISNNDPAKTISNDIYLSTGAAGISSRDVTVSGKISGPGALVVISYGRWLNLSNANNDFSGGLIFRGAGNNTLRFSTASAIGTGAITVEDNGILSPSANVAVSNDITLNAGKTLKVQAESTGPLLLSGVITGDGALSREGDRSSGTLTLAGVNDYTGGTTVKHGTLTVSGFGTFGAFTGNITAQGGILDLAGNSFPAGTVTISGGIIQNGSLDGTSYNGQKGFVFADLGGSGDLTMNSSNNRLVLAGTNTYSGTTTITNGTLKPITTAALPDYTSSTISVGGSGILEVNAGDWSEAEIVNLLSNTNLSFAAGGTLAINTESGDSGIGSAITTSDLGLMKLGANTLTLSGANTYTGKTTLNRGTVKIDAGAGGALAATSALTFTGTSTFNFDNTTAAGATSQALGALTTSAGDATVRLTRTAAQTVGLTFSSLAARPVGATSNFVIDGTPGTNGTDSSIVLSGVAADSFIDRGTFFGGSAYAWNDTAGFVRGVVYGSDAGTTTSGAAATLPSATHQQVTGGISAQDTATFTTLNIAVNNDFTLNAGATVSVDGILKSGNSASEISGGTGITTATADTDMVIRTDGASDSLTISTPILANGTSSLTKTGAGTLTLSAANTITGGVNLNEGQLNINHPDALGTATSRLTINDGTVIDNTSGGNILIPRWVPITINGSFTYIGTDGDLSLPDDSRQNMKMVNDITINVLANTLKIPKGFGEGGTGSLTKNGPGTLWIGTNGNSNYYGGLIVNAGVVTGDKGQPEQFAGKGPITLGATSGSDDAILSSSSNADHYGPITVRAGSSGIRAITAYGGSADWGGTVALDADLTLSAAGGNVYLSGIISGSGGLFIGNPGTYTISSGNVKSLVNTSAVLLTGNNTFTGETVMDSNSGGRLRLGGLDVLPNSTLDTGTLGNQAVEFTVPGDNTYNIGGLAGADNLNIGGNTISVGANGASTAYSGSISGSGGLTKVGGGTLALNGDNTYTGATTVTAGALGGDGTIAGEVIVETGATLAPGASAGTLSTGNTTMEASSLYEWEYDGATGDLVAVTGDLQLDSGWSLKLLDAGGTPATGSEHTLFTYTGFFSGSIAAVIDPTGDWTGISIGQDTTPGAGRIYLTFGLNGDADSDGDVDAADYIALKTNIGQASGATLADGDFDDDGDVDWEDLQILQDNYGAGSPGAPGTIPEPATLGLLAIGAIAVIRRRRAWFM